MTTTPCPFDIDTIASALALPVAPVDPFARSLANLEAVIGPFYLAITVARLVTLELEGRRV